METDINIAKKEISKRYRLLPQELQDLLIGESLTADLNSITALRELDNKSSFLLENEVALVLLLFTPHKDLAKNIETSLQIPKSLAEEIANDVALLILSEVEDILDFYEKRSLGELVGGNVPKATADTKDRLHLYPEGVEGSDVQEKETDEHAKPITHDELMSALSIRRTMADDINAIRNRQKPQSETSSPDTEKTKGEVGASGFNKPFLEEKSANDNPQHS